MCVLRRQARLIVLIIAVVTLAVFWRVSGHDFVAYDDVTYVTGNDHVRSGLTVKGLVWALTSTEAGNWHPLTWLSHMADVQFLGLAPGRHHLVNVVLHLANAALLFLVLRAFTGALLPSAIVAAFFALHPLHVESVSWVAERKDVLSTLFWLLTMGAYLGYVRGRTAGRYLVVVLLFALGLMAKPMLVTLPFLLVLLDWWPLGRFDLTRASTRHSTATPAAALAGALWEKLPLAALAAASCWVTIVAQQRGKAVVTSEVLPLGVRCANALVAYGRYLVKTFWPVDLAVFYPYPAAPPSLWRWGAALVVLAGITVFVVVRRRREPFLLVGWCWYLGTLVPVIGLVKVGAQFVADRYTYVPLIGIFIAAAWGVPLLCRSFARGRLVLGTAVGTALALCVALSWLQVGTWLNSRTLFEHALRVNPDNWLAHNNLGTVLTNAGKADEAIAHYQEALRIKPDYDTAHYNYANVLVGRGRIDEAVNHYREAVRLNRNYIEAYDNLGTVLLRQGNLEEAQLMYHKVLEINPDQPEAHNNLGAVLLKQGRRANALPAFAAAVRLDPDFFRARVNLGLLLGDFARWDEAVEHLTAAVRLNPTDAFARFNLERAERALREARGATR